MWKVLKSFPRRKRQKMEICSGKISKTYWTRKRERKQKLHEYRRSYYLFIYYLWVALKNLGQLNLFSKINPWNVGKFSRILKIWEFKDFAPINNFFDFFIWLP